MKTIGPSLLAVLALAWPLRAQVPDAAPAAPSSAPAPVSPRAPSAGPVGSSKPAGGGSPKSAGGGALGKDVPMFDPGNEILTWDGKSWNINNNRLFQARFEKYLNAPEDTTSDGQQYQAILKAIIDRLAPENLRGDSVVEAFRLLPRASNFDIDAHLCDALADAVYSVWMSKREYKRLEMANAAMDAERKKLEWNAGMSANTGPLNAPPGGGGKGTNNIVAQEWAKERQQTRDTRMMPYTQRLVEVNALIQANKLKRELSEVQTKIEFQVLVLQFFMQRRFQHVVMATRFYRNVFGDGDTKLRVGGDAEAFFNKSTGMPPTVAVLDTLAHEAMRDAREGVKAYDYLLQKSELESATKRLAEAFVVGEYLPELRTLSREKKRAALTFTQKGNQLISALDVRDYALAESIVKDLQVTAKDFDNSKPLAAIETARTVAAMHLAKAKNAAVSGDRATLEAELKEATEIWPRNPALVEASKMIFDQGDVQAKALVDLDQLIGQKNYRQVFNDQVRFIAATALYPERAQQLRKVLEDMQHIEGAIIQAREIRKRGDFAGAWENVERVFKQFPEDTQLNQLRADLTTEAADFVRTLRNAESLEQKERFGSSLAWYLRAQKIYPPSEYAQEGIDRLVKKIMPET